MRALDVLRMVVGFGTARALLFVAPVAMSNLLSVESYGRFELAQSWASIGALVLGCGLSGTVPLIRLREEIVARWDSLLLMAMLLAGVGLFVGLGVALVSNRFSNISVLALIMMCGLILQGLWAVTLKTAGRTTSAVFLEAGIWTVGIFGALIAVIGGNRLPERTIGATLLAYSVTLLTVTMVHFRRSRIGSITVADLRRNVGLGLPLMFTNILTVLILSSGRILIGQTSGEEDVGIYSTLYRCTALPLVAHQILTIGLFRQLFQWSDELLRVRSSLIVLGVTAMVLIFWLLEPALGFLLGQRFTSTFDSYRFEGLTLLLQTILWSAIALNDLINTRLQIAGQVASKVAPMIALGMGALWFWMLKRSDAFDAGEIISGFTRWHFSLVFSYFLAQCVASVRFGHRFYRLWLTVVLCAICAGGIVFLGEKC